MNKKHIISVGFFVLIVGIGAGIAYYFDPGAVNGILGIDAAQVDTLSDADISAIDASSTPLLDVSSEAGAISAPSVKKTVPTKENVTPAAGAASASGAGGGDASDVAAPVSVLPPQTSQSGADQVSVPSAPCAFPSASPSTTQKIIFNEIAWMGSASSSVAEWMELKNNSSDTADLSGWKLSDASGKIAVSFSDGDAIAPGGFLLLARGSAVPGVDGGAVEKRYSGDLANGGDTLAITDPQCAVSDYFDASRGWPAGDNATKATMERDDGGAGWHTSALPGGTPDAENSAGVPQTPVPIQQNVATTTAPANAVAVPSAPTASADSDASATDDNNDGVATTTTTIDTATSTAAVPASTSSGDTVVASSTPPPAPPASSTSSVAAVSGHILIAAVQVAGASSSNDFVRLYNPTGAAVDMSGWKLHKKSNTGGDYSLKVFPTGSVIAAGGTFVWANSGGGFSENIGANVSSTETLAADNSVALLDAAGNVVDAVAWGTGAGQYGEGPPYPTDPVAGQLLARVSSGGAMADTGNNMNDFTLQ